MRLSLIFLLFLSQIMAKDYSSQYYRESLWKIYTEALQGDSEAQFQTGVIFERGIGLEKNETKAAYWYEKAAMQGHVDAQYNVGIMYAGGRGVEQNMTAAVHWFREASAHGDKESAILLDKIQKSAAMPQKSSSPVQSSALDSFTQTENEYQRIVPVTLVSQEPVEVCTKPQKQGVCETFKAKTVFTSTSKDGSFYKISGIVLHRKWQDYGKEGWISDTEISIRK